MRGVTAFLLGALVLSAVPAAAQDEDRRVNFNLGAGYTFATGAVRDHVGDGYNVNVGLIINATKMFGVQVEYNFNGLGEKQVNVPVSPTPNGTTTSTPFFANTSVHAVNFNVILKPKVESAARPYVLGGVGVYYRPVDVTTPGVGYVPGYCDPWWYVCYPGGFVPVDKILGSRSETAFGIDLGGGVNFRVSDSASVYVEVRYHYIFGKDYTVSGATSAQGFNSSGSYIPITFGVRF